MRILVVGDIMLDRYVFGDVSRISQEAPVPIVARQREEKRAGAAANVAANCATLGAEVTLVGIVGADYAATAIEAILPKGVRCNLVRDPHISTTEKMRIIGKNQQIVRVDSEQTPTIVLGQETRDEIKAHDIIVFSDYGKGALKCIRVMIALAKEYGKTVLVDPKGYDYSRYAGADLVKPNINEMREMAGGWDDESGLRFKADTLRSEALIGAVLVTRASDGMTLYDGATEAHLHAVAKEIYDVTGAGDTVMAALAVMLAEGRSLYAAAVAANYAAGIAVSRFGTYAVTREELNEVMNVC